MTDTLIPRRSVQSSMEHLLIIAARQGLKPHRFIMGPEAGDRLCAELDETMPGWDDPLVRLVKHGWQRIDGGKYKAVELKVYQDLTDIRLEITTVLEGEA